MRATEARPAPRTQTHAAHCGPFAIASLCVVALTAFVGSSAPVAGAAEPCPNEVIREQQHAAFLPDCRAYELVSPGARKGIDAFSYKGIQIAPNGEKVAYRAINAFGDASHAMANLDALGYAATRQPDGRWNSTFVSDPPVPPNAMQSGPFEFAAGLAGASQDLSLFFTETTYGSSNVGFQSGVYAHAWGSACAHWVAPQSQFVGSASNGSQALFSTSQPFAPITCAPEPCTPPVPLANARLLYQQGAGSFSLVNVDDTGNLLSRGGALLADRTGATNSGGALVSARHAVSIDGSKVFFRSQRPQDNPSTSSNAARQLYVRIDGDQTLLVSAPDPAIQPPPAAAQVLFAGASADGERAYFVTAAKLTQDASGAGPFLYQWDLTGPGGAASLKLVAGNSHPVGTSYSGSDADGSFNFAGANVIVASDGSRAYYYSPDEGGSVYLYDAASGDTILVADNTGLVQLAGSFTGNGRTGADITPDGAHLAFISTSGFSDGRTGRQIYVFDAATQQVDRISRGPAEPNGSFYNEFYSHAHSGAQTFPLGGNGGALDPNFISDDGRYVFFASDAPLVATDVNGVRDVYRWSRGEGVALISSGSAPEQSVLLGASPDGADVFFMTGNDLVAEDGDDWRDIYDARIDGGAENGRVGTGCREDSCQGPLAGSIEGMRPASASFEGVSHAGSRRRPRRPHPMHCKRRANHKIRDRGKRGGHGARNLGIHRPGKDGACNAHSGSDRGGRQ